MPKLQMQEVKIGYKVEVRNGGTGEHITFGEVINITPRQLVVRCHKDDAVRRFWLFDGRECRRNSIRYVSICPHDDQPRDKERWTKLKDQFRARVLYYLEEYITEGEHDEGGLPYWNQFDNEWQALEDFVKFLESMADTEVLRDVLPTTEPTTTEPTTTEPTVSPLDFIDHTTPRKRSP